MTATAMLAGTAAAQAQESRTQLIEQQQTDKSKALTPAEPGKVEAAIVELKNKMLVAPSGFYPTTDSVYSGGGFTLGVGYRRFFADRSFWNVHGMYSIKNYKAVALGVTSQGWLRGRLDVTTNVGWRDATQVGYFGLGIDTPSDDEGDFRLQQAYAGALATFKPVRWVLLRGGTAYEDYTDEEGQGSAPSIETIYSPATAPGLGESPNFLHTQGTAGIDWRTSPGYSRRGGFYGATLHAFTGYGEISSFQRLDLDAVQHVPILRETWVLSVRGRLQTTLGDDLVPYFLMPSVGGGSTLRGYSSFRFRDRQSLLMSGEWRWIPNASALDMALFYDAGTVADRLEGLRLNEMKHDVGIGVRFHGPTATPLRIEMARGSEGWHLVFAGGAAF